MNFRTTVVLLVVLALFAGAYIYVTKAYPAVEEGKTPTLLGAFEQARVERLRVDNQEMGYRVEVARTGPDAWKMTYPLEDAPADEALVSQILSAVAYNTRKPVSEFPAGTAANLEAYGLAKPRAVLDFELKAAEGKPGTRLRLLVGGEDIRKDDLFCGVGPPLLPGKEAEWKPTGVVRTPANVWNSVNKTVDQYRDPRAFSIRSMDAESFDVFRDGALALSLVKEEGAWQERAPRRERADRFVADGFLGQVLGWRIARFHENAPGPDANYGLDPPRIEIVVREGSKTERLRIGKEHPDGLLARRADSKFVWALKPEDVKGLEKNPEEFLDRKLFRFFSDEATEVRLGRPEGEIVLAREGGSRSFRLKLPKELETASDRTDGLLADLEKLEIASFEPPIVAPGDSRPASGPVLDEALKRYGLDAPPRWIQVAAKGKPAKILVGKREGESWFVRREGSENVGRMKGEDLERLFSREALHYLTREIVSLSEFDLAAIEVEASRPPETQPASAPTQPSGEVRKARWIREEGGKWKREASEGTASAPSDSAAFTAALDSIVHLKGDEARAWSAEGFPFDKPLAVLRYWKGTPASRPAAGAPPAAEVKIAEREGSVAVGPSGVVYAIASDLVARIRALP
ncbi:MAG TPA: DUF4340 domain-containing protein [Planctomycetota bacterium]|jgi:hypothetical protein|nr:DUF4340 domain-containing protein [Planctomycetota bacterium]